MRINAARGIIAMSSKTYKDTFVSPQHTILQALEVINSSAMQVALVVDDEKTLLGTVTDGDVRRGLLSNISMSSSVVDIMNKNPTRVVQGTDLEKILEIMALRKIHQMPVLNEDGQVVALYLLDDLLEQKQASDAAHKPVYTGKNQNAHVMLMVGGEGRRLQPLTNDLPKPMISVGGKPLLETIIGNFVSQGYCDFSLSVNYKADIIRDHFRDGSEFGANISYVLETQKMGTAGSLSLLEQRPDTPIIVMNGDLLTNIDFRSVVDFHCQNRSLATMCVREYKHEIPYGIVQNQGTKLDSVVEKPTQTHFVNAGIYVLEPKAIDLVPEREYFDMPDLFSAINEAGGEASVFPIHEYWMDIGRMEDLEKAREEYASVFMPAKAIEA